MNKFKFITSCLLVMVMGLSFVSCEEVSDALGVERGFDSYYDLKVVSCERIGANLRIDFTLKNKTGKTQQEVTLSNTFVADEYCSDNVGNTYLSRDFKVSIDGGPWKNFLTFPMSKDETISGSFLIEDFDPTNTAKTFNLVFWAEWTTRENGCIAKKKKIAITDNRLLSNGFQTNDKKLEYKHIKSFIDEDDAYITFSLKNNTGKTLTGVKIQPNKLTDNQGSSYPYAIHIFHGNDYNTDFWDYSYALEGIVLEANESITATIYAGSYPNPNATKFSGELYVTAGNYNVTDNIVRFFTVPVTSKDYVPQEEEEEEEEGGDNTTIISQEFPGVDLGLSVRWATYNVGASSPTDCGDFFAWGELNTKPDYSKGNCLTYGLETINILTDPNATSISGEASYDIAAAKSNGQWRMPTKEEMQELIEQCTWEWGNAGYTVIGPNGNSIFLPASGYQSGVTISNEKTFGGYWSASLSESDTKAILLGFTPNNSYSCIEHFRFNGHNIRPVLAEENTSGEVIE